MSNGEKRRALTNDRRRRALAVAVAALWGNETKEIFSSAAAEQRMTRRPTETVSVPPPPSPRPPFGEPQQLSPQGWREGYCDVCGSGHLYLRMCTKLII